MQAKGKPDRSTDEQERGPIFPADSQNEQRASYAAAAAGDLGRDRQKDGRCPHQYGSPPGGKTGEGSARGSVRNRNARKAETEKALRVVGFYDARTTPERVLHQPGERDEKAQGGKGCRDEKQFRSIHSITKYWGVPTERCCQRSGHVYYVNRIVLISGDSPLLFLCPTDFVSLRPSPPRQPAFYR
jgi:hypothetical protein